MSYRIVIYTKRNVISILISCIIAKKCAKLQSHIASLEMHGAHAHRKFQPKWVRTRTSQLDTAHRKSCFAVYSTYQGCWKRGGSPDFWPPRYNSPLPQIFKPSNIPAYLFHSKQVCASSTYLCTLTLCIAVQWLVYDAVQVASNTKVPSRVIHIQRRTPRPARYMYTCLQAICFC